MAYMNKEKKDARAPEIKKILKKYGMKGTLSVSNYSTLRLKLKDIRGFFKWDSEYHKKWGQSINVYSIYRNYEGELKDMLTELSDAMYGKDYFDDSDMQTDYFNCSHYISINVFPAK